MAISPRVNGSQHHLSMKGGVGFSLIEILVVIAIIAILSSIVLASLSSARARGRDGRRVSDVKQLQLALALYYDANRVFPPALDDPGNHYLTGAGFIPAIPKDPQTGNNYQYAALAGASSDPNYCLSYHLGATLEQNSTTPGTPLSNDVDAMAGGAYGTTNDGTLCIGSGSDFDGTDPIFDVRP